VLEPVAAGDWEGGGIAAGENPRFVVTSLPPDNFCEGRPAGLLIERLRTLTLQGSELATATAGAIRLRLLKVAARVTVSVRRVYVQLSSAFPLQALFRQVQQRLRQISATDG
jgi:hypothetical protein